MIRWTSTHKAEAVAFIVGRDHHGPAFRSAESEKTFRAMLRYKVGLDSTEVEAAVLRVDGLATGRLVRDVEIQVRRGQAWINTYEDDENGRACARSYARENGGRVVRLVRIRKSDR